MQKAVRSGVDPAGGATKSRAPQTSASDAATSSWLNQLDRLGSGKIKLFIALASMLAFANSLGGQFLFDDTDQIVRNPSLRSWTNLVWAFRSHVWQFKQGPQFLRAPVPPPYYRPIFTVLLTIEYHIFGLWPQGWHIVSIGLHILCGILVFRVAELLLGRRSLGAIAGLVFAVFPIHAESVSWVSGATDPLCGVFLLAALYWYLRFRLNRARRRLLVLSLFLFLFSLLSKETGICLIAMVFLFELIEGLSAIKTGSAGLGWVNSLRLATVRSLPFVAVGLIYLLARGLVLGGHAWARPYADTVSLADCLKTVPLVLWTYIAHLVWPVGLTVAYQTHFVTNVASPEFLIPTAATALSAIALIAFRHRISREVWISLGLIFMPLLPVMYLNQLYKDYLVFDRFLYLSVAGVGCLLALGVQKLADPAPPRGDLSIHRSTGFSRNALAGISLLLLLAAMTALTARENGPWKDDYSLWSNATRHRPNFWAAHYNVGRELMARNAYPEALAEFSKALDLAPGDPSILTSIGQVYDLEGDLDSAASSYRQAIASDPQFFESLNNLGTVYFKKGEYSTAESWFAAALAIKPEAADCHYNLGLCYEKQDRLHEAAGEFSQALAALPDDPVIFYELGQTYLKLGRSADAVDAFKSGLRVAKGVDIRDQLRDSLSRLGASPN